MRESHTFSREEIGSTAGFEVFDEQTPELLGEKVAKRAVEQLSAKSPKGGTFPVVLGPNVVGVFVHEAFGHLAEADLALSGGVLAGNIGKKIGSKLVTFYDDGTIDGSFGSFKYDDEGVQTQKTLLLKDGVVAGLIHNRETAQKFNAESTGNARAEDFRVEPIIRMRCTYMAPRDRSFEELIEDVKQGYYFKSFRGGQANLDGTFQVGIQEGYEINNGEIGAPVRDASISGNTLETLHHVDAVGKDFVLDPEDAGKVKQLLSVTVDRILELRRWLSVAVLEKDKMLSLAENAVKLAIKREHLKLKPMFTRDKRQILESNWGKLAKPIE